MCRGAMVITAIMMRFATLRMARPERLCRDHLAEPSRGLPFAVACVPVRDKG